jgi:hypothetical protein
VIAFDDEYDFGRLLRFADFLSPFALAEFRSQRISGLRKSNLPRRNLFLRDRQLVFGDLTMRVVTLAMGTASALVCERVSISAVTDMPGGKIRLFVDADAHLELRRRLRRRRRAESCCALVELEFNPSDELATAVTTPVNFLSLNESTSSRPSGRAG